MVSIAWIPIGIIFALVIGYGLTEFAFLFEAKNTIGTLNEKEADCYLNMVNSTFIKGKFCKSDYGFLGWKQWTSDKEEELIEKSLLRFINPPPERVIIVPDDFKGQINLQD